MAGRTTNFQLTQDQERDLVDYCLQRFTSLRADNLERVQADKASWEAYDNQHPERKGGIWDQSSLVLPFIPMVVDSCAAKAEDDILDTDPFIKYTAIGRADEAEAKVSNSYFRYKFGPRGANLKRTFHDAMLPLFIQRAVVTKVVFVDQKSEWMNMETRVLHAIGPDGSETPVQTLGSDGEPQFVTEDNAAWIDEEALDGSVRRVLSTDPSVVNDPATTVFKTPQKGVLESFTKYRGAKAVVLDSDAFFCPTDAKTIEDADFKCELYDKSVSYVETIAIDRPWEPVAGIASKLEGFAEAKRKDLERNVESKENLQFDEKAKSVRIIECWVRRDVLGWGRPQDFVILIEERSKTAIFYEYVNYVCPDMQCPYVGGSIFRKKGYWWGPSLPEKLRQYQDYMDLQFNRHSARNARNANPLGAMNPNAVEENPDAVEVGAGELFTLKPGKSIMDFVQFANIPNLDMDTQQLLEFVQYMVQKWLAISDIGQGDYSNLPQNSTKYGIQATQKESNKINRRYGRRIIEYFELVADKMTKLQRDQLDEPEVFELTDGDMNEVATLTPDTLRSYNYNVAIEIGQQLTEDDVNAAREALAVQAQYFAILDPVQRSASRKLFGKILETLNFKDVDALLPEVPPPMPPTMPDGSMPPAAPVQGGPQ